MNKNQFARKVARKLGIPYEAGRTVVKSLFEVLADEIVAGNEIHINKFGNFKKKVVKARQRFDINNKTIVEEPEKVIFEFEPSKILIERLLNK